MDDTKIKKYVKYQEEKRNPGKEIYKHMLKSKLGQLKIV